MHFHDTYGRGVQNAAASAELGIAIFDSSAGGIGGCPYAPGATCNVATQDLVELFAGRTTVDRRALEEASRVIERELGTGKGEVGRE
jgi:hydroxymethylglutaryl-CoA lyase